MNKSETDLRNILDLKVEGKGCKNYSVKAGAGAGKTTMLSHRICKQILMGTPLDSFVIITYTNAAASELRSKITSQLHKLISNGISNPQQLKNATDALNSIELMQISTIHSFLFKILRENSFESGIVLDARMLEEAEDIDRKNTFFDNWYHDHYSEIKNLDISIACVYTSDDGHTTDHTYEVLKNMFSDLANIREEVVYDTSDNSDQIRTAAEKYLDIWLPRALSFLEIIEETAPIVNGERKMLNAATNAKSWISTVNLDVFNGKKGLKEAIDLSDSFAKIIRYINKTTGDFFFGSKYLELEKEVADACPFRSLPKYEWNFRYLYEKIMSKASSVSRIAEYASVIQKAYQKENDNNTLFLSNDDILFRAEKLLTENTTILNNLRRQYSKIYVDEFQDTTGLQARLIKMLSEKPSDNPGECPIDDNKLLLVGDPKQSIYRFTGAEKNVYDQMDNTMDNLPNSIAESVVLRYNFRSNSAIVDWVNSRFSKIMKSDYSDMSTDWSVSDTNSLYRVFRYGAEQKEGDYIDAEAVANLVNQLVGKPRYYIEQPHYNDDGSLGVPYPRQIRYDDIMIICKTTKHMTKYVEEFNRLGIPVIVNGKLKVEHDEVLRNFLLLTAYIAGYKSKKKQKAAIQVCKGADITDKGEEFPCNSAGVSEDPRNALKKCYNSPASVIQYLLSHEELFVPKNKEFSIEDVRSYRTRLHQMTESCLAKNDGDLNNLVSLMNEYMQTDVTREIPLESNENAVRLLNVHKAKGLTGNIVIIADRSSEEECRFDGFRKDGKYYPSAKFKHIDGGSPVIMPSFGHDMDFLWQAKKDEEEEAIRLQYVAATRAAYALIFMPATKKTAWFTAKEYELDKLPDINGWIEEHQQIDAPVTAEIDSPENSHEISTLEDLLKYRDETVLNKLGEKQMIIISPSLLEPKTLAGYTSTDPGYIKESRPTRDIFGTAMHRTYQLLVERHSEISSASAEDRDAIITQTINQSILESIDDFRANDDPDEFLAYLKPKMTDYFECIISPIVSSAAEVYTEYAFSFFIDGSERDAFLEEFTPYLSTFAPELITDKKHADTPVWINGQADLVVLQKDGSVKIYDYKSDAMNGKPIKEFEKSLNDKYAGQLALYRYAIRKTFSTPKVDTELIHLYR